MAIIYFEKLGRDYWTVAQVMAETPTQHSALHGMLREHSIVAGTTQLNLEQKVARLAEIEKNLGELGHTLVYQTPNEARR